MTPLIAFLLTLLATLRLTRLVIDDKISKPFRDSLASRAATSLGEASGVSHTIWSLLSQLFECPWCIGFWISGVSAAVELHVANPVPTISLWWSYPALTLSLSWLVGMIHTAMYVLEDQ